MISARPDIERVLFALHQGRPNLAHALLEAEASKARDEGLDTDPCVIQAMEMIEQDNLVEAKAALSRALRRV